MDRTALPTALERRQWPAGSNQCHRRLSSLSTPWLSVVGTVDDLRPLPDGENGVPDNANVQPLQRQVDQGTIWTALLCPPLSSAASGRRGLTNVTDASAASALHGSCVIARCVVGTVDDLRPLPDGENGVPDSANVQPLDQQM